MKGRGRGLRGVYYQDALYTCIKLSKTTYKVSLKENEVSMWQHYFEGSRVAHHSIWDLQMW